ncbi:AAA family ATPase [Lentibacillus sp. CBA3610]|uniref:AAA family ATPase n=1 Tax=Lentibacillus sp. CBA3610 TaxID=2518176 RepID=UPI0015955F25|nr:AAA family ATPase [Lentibacillus sp. CBA3610]QKY71311.1 ATP-dependent Clp protease ATP-binding subunit [Lentibacillus sp. CBA3610]
MNNKITIFNGPKKEFTKILPDTYENFTDIIRIIDSKLKEVKLVTDLNDYDHDSEKLYAENLVVYSDEYTGVNDHVIDNFINHITMIYEIDNLFLQNPPEKLRNQFKRESNGRLEIVSYPYKLIDKDILKQIKEGFSNKIIGQIHLKMDLLSVLYPLVQEQFEKPVVILFYGPTGVGKTETARYISTLLEGELFRKQFSMFQNESFASYLFGQGTKQSSFAKDLLDRESNIIVLDEFDKANQIFHSAFYQMFDEGVFVDKDHTVNLGKALIICTSNYKSESDIKRNLGELFSRFDGDEFKLYPGLPSKQ